MSCFFSAELSTTHESEPFPEYLSPFAFKDARSYLEALGNSSISFDTPEDDVAYRFTTGNWLRRWQVSKTSGTKHKWLYK